MVKGSIRLTTKQPLITRSFVILLTAFEYTHPLLPSASSFIHLFLLLIVIYRKTEVDEYSVSVHPDKIASGSLATAFTPKKKSYKSTRYNLFPSSSSFLLLSSFTVDVSFFVLISLFPSPPFLFFNRIILNLQYIFLGASWGKRNVCTHPPLFPLWSD